jgi:hypothetical protein
MRTKDQILLENIYLKRILKEEDETAIETPEEKPEGEHGTETEPKTEVKGPATPLEKQAEGILKKDPEEGLSDEEVKKIEALIDAEGGAENA